MAYIGRLVALTGHNYSAASELSVLHRLLVA